MQGNPSFIFTLIQKFNKKDVQPIIPDHDIIIMSDEAHRSQYGIFADNMVNLLPTAARIGFTGTPLLLNDNITERTFGGYISIYDFKRAVEDKATVPLYYENRGEKILDLDNPDITDKILDAIEATDLDPNQTKKLEREFKKEIHIMTAPQRLKSVAKDFVSHYSDLWTSGKAMFVCLNKVTCVRMYNLVQNYWEEEIKRLEGIKSKVSQQEVQELERKIKWMKETEMAVVISQEQNEIQTFKKWDLDIKPHREKMEKRELDKEFKDKDNPLRVVFVCAMWLTGFDVKCLSCLYLDKPLKAHTLMQTIARANRVAEGKSNGLIIDYIGIVKALRKALADYTANVGGIIFPYTYDENGLVRFGEGEFERLYPEAAAYLNEFRDDLSKRQSDNSAKWYEYGRSQALSGLNSKKLLISTVVTNDVDVYELEQECIPYAGMYIVEKEDNNEYELIDAMRILRSGEFKEYVFKVGIPISGKSVRITSKDVENYMF